jgi:hypothetical protein
LSPAGPWSLEWRGAMSTCPSSCTGTCPEIVPVEITQNIIEFTQSVTEYTFEDTGDGSTQEFTLAHTPVAMIVVSIGGVVQPPSAYDLDGAVITFDDAPADGEPVFVRCLVAS